MDAEGVPRAEIARRLRLSRNTVAKYADMEDLSPEPPAPADRPHPAIDPHAAWIDGVLEADLGAPRKQRHTAKRIYDRLVEERRYEGSYSAVQRHVREWRLARAARAGGGYLELEWAPGTAQGDYGNFEAVVSGERPAPEAPRRLPAPLERALRRRRHVPARRVHVRGAGRRLRVDRAGAPRARPRQRHRGRPAGFAGRSPSRDSSRCSAPTTAWAAATATRTRATRRVSCTLLSDRESRG